MKRLALLLVWLSAATALAQPLPKTPAKGLNPAKLTYLPPTNMAVAENHVRAATNFVLQRIAQDDKELAGLKALELRAFDDNARRQAANAVRDYQPTAPFLRFASFYNAPTELLAEWKADFVFQINHLHRKQRLLVPQDVPASDGRLVVWDIRDAGWNIAAAQAVFERDPFMVAPHVLGVTAARLNSLLGLKNFRRDRLHCLGVVRADWFIRETSESLRSTAYYDLLFAAERFPEPTFKDNGEPFALRTGDTVKKIVKQEVEETVTTWEDYKHTGGKLPGFGDKEYAPGNYQLPKEAKKKVVKDVLQEVPVPPTLILVPLNNKALKNVGTAKGDGTAVVDFPKLEADWEKAFGIDRVKDLQKVQALDLENGAVVEGREAAGSIVARQNRLLLRLPGVLGQEASYYWKTFDAEKTLAARNYFQTLVFNFDFDAGETIVSTPVGAQAYGLWNKKGERQEFVPEALAIDSTDKYDHRVRNPNSCQVCHTAGINTPDDMITKFFKEGGEFKTLSKEKQEKVETYFKNWQDKLRADQAAYARFVKRATNRAPAENARAFAAAREYYDDPVTLERAAVELGLRVDVLRALCRRGAEARVVALALQRPFPVPRTTWDVEVFPTLALLMDLFRGEPLTGEKRPLQDAELDALVDKALEKFLDERAKAKKE